MRDDSTILRDCLAGDASAWNELVERYGRLVYSIPSRLGFGAADADDVVQTVFGIALRRLETLRDETRLSAWLIRTTYRECWRLRRRMKSAAELPEDVDADGQPSEARLEQEERQVIVRQALEKIDERCRRLLHALFFEQPTPAYDLLAERLGVPVGSIGPTRARCFQKMEGMLAKFAL